MCGICGIVSLEGPLAPELRASIRGMSDAIAHRGPDDEGFFGNEYVAFGHRRLSIIDIARGHQPIANEDGTCWIIFNGEVYNHHALRARLEGLGHVFRTKSDTEAILHAWEQFGPSCVELLEGMFAFAIVDTNKQEVFLARDRLGKKPIYYGVFGGALHFASEIKALRRSPAFDAALAPDFIHGYLLLGYSIAPSTAYRHVRQLQAGHSLHVRRGQVTVRRYWDVTEFDTDTRPAGAVIDELDTLLGSAVAERLESEVPLGVFLSGGIDSGLVTSHMAERSSQPVVATSIGFASAAHDELAAARLTAQHVGARMHEAIVHPALDEALTLITEGFDEPFADPSAIPTWHVARLARKHVTVALSGDGGDESFSGYTFRYAPLMREARLRQTVDGPASRRVASALGAVWPRAAHWGRITRVGTLLDNMAVEPHDAYFRDLCFMKPRAAARLLGRSDPHAYRAIDAYTRTVDAFRACSSPSLLQKTQYADLMIYLANDVLPKVDRMSMQSSLEVRAPLLDRRLVEFAFRLPTATKMPDLQGKYLLRRLADRRLPAGLASLPKKGFSPPLAQWLAGDGGRLFADEVLTPTALSRDWLDQAELAAVFSRRGRARSDEIHALWASWLFERWLRKERVSSSAGVPLKDPRGEVA